MIVETAYGKVEGVVKEGTAIFQGIPYAKAPIGEKRFRKPETPDSWEGVKETKIFSPKCPQLRIPVMPDNGIAQDEDCLYMNIYAPQNTDDKKPVLFWIYGGALSSGEGSTEIYDGCEFVKNGDVVVVNFNYRVGVFGGFYNFNSYEGCEDYVPNVGLYDVLAALKWTRDNIEQFGGDPERITICGESAGASIVAALLCWPEAKGLFSQAILESTFNYMPTETADKEITDRIISCSEASTAEEFLKLDTDKLMDAVSKSCDGNPVVCGAAFQKTDWFSVPISAMLAQPACDVPVLIGFNHDEGFIMVPPGSEQSQINQMTHILFESVLESFLANGQQSPVYLYRFDYVPAPLKAQGMGAIHSAEMSYVYHTITASSEQMPQSDLPASDKVSLEMHHDWIRFLNGNAPWEAYSTNNAFKVFDTTSEIRNGDWHVS